MTRYIENTFDENELAANVHDRWLFDQAATVAGYIDTHIERNPTIVNSNEPYTGLSGIAFAYIYAAPHLGQKWLDKARMMLSIAARGKSSHHHRNRRYLTGHIGTLTVMASDPMRSLNIKSIEEEIKSAALEFSDAEEEVENEMLNGRAGLLGSILWLRQHVDPNLFTDESCRDAIEQICQYLLYKGARTSDKSCERSAPPLMYFWHETMYIGAAHGLAGILLVLISMLNEFEESHSSNSSKRYPQGLKSRIRSTVDWLVSIQTADGGFASSLDYVTKPKSYDLVHWCHGAPGVIPTLLKAYQVYGDPEYLRAAERGGEHIWTKGILKKGPGLCHGVSGNGITFLFLWKATGNQKWLNRAKAFAYLMLCPDIQSLQRTPDSPYSLYEGWAGGLCLLVNLLPSNLNSPRFPLYPYFC